MPCPGQRRRNATTRAHHKPPHGQGKGRSGSHKIDKHRSAFLVKNVKMQVKTRAPNRVVASAIVGFLARPACSCKGRNRPFRVLQMVVSFIVINAGRLFQSFAYCFFSDQNVMFSIQKLLTPGMYVRILKVVSDRNRVSPFFCTIKNMITSYAHVLDVKRCQIRRFVSQKLIRVCRTSEVSGDAFLAPYGSV